MRCLLPRVVLIVVCVLFGVAGVSPRASASDKKKWAASKKHHKAHHKSSSKPAAGAAAKGAAPAPAEEAGEDEGDETADKSDDKGADEDAKAKPATAKTKVKAGDDDEREASDDRGGGGDDDDSGSAGVVRRKAKKRPVVSDDEGGGLVALELTAGPRIVHRSFAFNDPLSNYTASAAKPYSYALDKAPAPFIDLAFYPAAFATHGFGANIGIVGSFEKIVGTKTVAADGSSQSTDAQQFDVGARVRVPVGESEVGVAATYGQQTFHVTATDPGPAGGASVPNVDYTYAGLMLDGRLRLGIADLGAHVGSRFVFKTGSLAQNWFPTTKTTSIAAGVSAAFRITPLVGVVVGGDLMRYAFDFNPVPTNNALVAGGAVDQYLSGYVALRVLLSGG